MKIFLIVLLALGSSSLNGQQKLEPLRVGIIVKDVDQVSRWYETNLGFTTYKRMAFPQYDSLQIFFLRQGDFEIELVQKRTSFSIKSLRKDYDINKEPLEGFVKIVFRVKDIVKIHDKVKRNGVKEILGITHDKEFDLDFFMIEDPDGNLLQFVSQ
jgi:catechol 2,3-dioxygenase-like lactoylglutathione lyase family enzyme